MYFCTHAVLSFQLSFVCNVHTHTHTRLELLYKQSNSNNNSRSKHNAHKQLRRSQYTPHLLQQPTVHASRQKNYFLALNKQIVNNTELRKHNRRKKNRTIFSLCFLVGILHSLFFKKKCISIIQ